MESCDRNNSIRERRERIKARYWSLYYSAQRRAWLWYEHWRSGLDPFDYKVYVHFDDIAAYWRKKAEEN